MVSVSGFAVFSAQVQADSQSNTVLLSDNGRQLTVPTNVDTVADLLKKLNIHLAVGDVVEPTPTTKIDQDNFRVNIYRGVPVKVTDSEHSAYTFSAASSPRQVAEQAGIKVYPEDFVSRVPVNNFVNDQAIAEKVEIDRATPVSLSIYGSHSTVRTHLKTVADLLADRNIKLHKGDVLTPSVSTQLTPNIDVEINHKGVKYQTITEDIAFPVEYLTDSSLSVGSSALRQTGQLGAREVTYKINTKNGKETSRTLTQSVVITQPVEQIVVWGIGSAHVSSKHQAWMAAAGIDSSNYGYVDYIVSHESGWCATKWQGHHGDCPDSFSPLYSLNAGLGYGLGQSTPAINMSSFGDDWQTNPITQLKWADTYAKSHWGSWQSAYMHWRSSSWW